ncbi:MAG: hypothetical protein U5K76_13785, partial [Woeseiaceae bacterium]|nr:hypothetical protein [Woeseiaceae bacterium]
YDVVYSQALEHDFNLRLDIPQWIRDDTRLNEEGVRVRCVEGASAAFEEKKRTSASSSCGTSRKR